METYYYCKTDNYGQRTGYVGSIKLHKDQVKTDQYGFKTYKGMYLYESKFDADRASLS